MADKLKHALFIHYIAPKSYSLKPITLLVSAGINIISTRESKSSTLCVCVCVYVWVCAQSHRSEHLLSVSPACPLVEPAVFEQTEPIIPPCHNSEPSCSCVKSCPWPTSPHTCSQEHTRTSSLLLHSAVAFILSLSLSFANAHNTAKHTG